jgi:diguanylate cyclase (GGDEF)-like protein
MQAMRDHLSGKKATYEVEYRIKTKAGDYKWYYDRGSIVKRDDNGKPLLVVGIVFDITESILEKEKLRIENKELTKQTNIDPLTKIDNRRALANHLTQEISRAKQNTIPLSIGMYDIDDFKKVNDTEGHPYGDKVLVKIANIMREDLRDLDIVGRYGGEEFMIIFPYTKKESAKKVSDRIRKKIINAFKEENKTITISGGVALYEDNLDEEAFIKKADDNLYKAKANGKNRII